MFEKNKKPKIEKQLHQDQDASEEIPETYIENISDAQEVAIETDPYRSAAAEARSKSKELYGRLSMRGAMLPEELTESDAYSANRAGAYESAADNLDELADSVEEKMEKVIDERTKKSDIETHSQES
jgi:hypothetical protein